MVAPEVADRKQKAVLWAATGHDNFGRVTIAAKTEIRVRWVEKQQEGLNDKGEKIAIDATVVVNREIAVGSIMWKGALDDVADPPVGLKQVIAYNETPDIKNRKVRRTVLLMRYSDQLPAVT